MHMILLFKGMGEEGLSSSRSIKVKEKMDTVHQRQTVLKKISVSDSQLVGKVGKGG